MDQEIEAVQRHTILPEDLKEAMTELSAIRDVLVHRAGRIDQAALNVAPSLRFKLHEFIRLTRADYRKYSAAIAAYGDDITQRMVNGGRTAPSNLASWKLMYRINA